MERNRTNFDFLNEIESPFKANAIKENEEDKWIITCGNLDVFPFKFDTKEQAESFIKEKLPQGYIWMAMTALTVKIIENYKLLKKEKK